MKRPADHDRRAALSDEVHARPPEVLTAPARISYLALLRQPGQPDERPGLAALAQRYAAPPPGADDSHYSADLGAFRLKWEHHTEFSRYMFIVEGAAGEPFAETAIERVPAEFVAALPGEVIAASHAVLVAGGLEAVDVTSLADHCFAGNPLVGSEIGGRAAAAFTDFRIHPDGFSRFVIRDRDMTPRQAGRLLQRLLEIETYRTMALLALPIAQALIPFLRRSEQELAEITNGLAAGADAEEAPLLDRLTRLAAGLERHGAENHFRFGAAAAYHALVGRRIAELRETRVPGLQTFGEFIDRRLVPAMTTCGSAAARQEALSQRVARATQLLSTRIEVTQARQNQRLLHSMDRRAQLQLRLQETVEGLSVAAVTYYVVGLVGYAAKGVKPLGLDLNPDLVVAASIPVVILVTALGVRRIRRSVADRAHDSDPVG